MGKMQRDKGNRVEREIVNLLKEAGVFAERVPLSGASGYRDEGHDINIYAWGRDRPPLVFEVKARKQGAGFKLLKRWLGQHDGLVNHEDRAENLVTIPWRVLIALLTRSANDVADHSTATRPKPKNGPIGTTYARPAAGRGDDNEHFVEP
jgi:Holliday junction resolvase